MVKSRAVDQVKLQFNLELFWLKVQGQDIGIKFPFHKQSENP